MTQTQQLLVQIQDFCRETGMAETTFGQRAVHEWTLVERLRAGKTITLSTAERVREYIASYSRGSARGRKKGGSGKASASTAA